MEINQGVIPLVSICCITYNHELYIKKCIEGFLMQETDFAFEIIIHDDASTDNTATIIKEYQAKHPHLFNCIFQNENQFEKQNSLFKIVFPMAKGKYIAMCDGDDYWTDKKKLQKQIDFLERNDDYVLCGHETLVMNYTNSNVTQELFSNLRGFQLKNDFTDVEFITSIYPFHFSSIVFKNVLDLNEKFQNIFFRTWSGDNALYIALAHFGKIHCLNDVMSVYNIRSNGFTAKRFGHNLILNYVNLIETCQDLDAFYLYKHNDIINEVILNHFDKMMFNKSHYPNKLYLLKDLLKFTFTNKYGKKEFFKKIKYSIKILMNKGENYELNK